MDITTFFFTMMLITLVSRAITKQIEKRKEDQLLERNPEAWKKTKDLEMEKKDHDRRAMGGAAVSLFKMFSRK